jgi:hypothetical protein
VGAEAGVVEVPLVAGGRAHEALHAGGRRIGVELHGTVEVAQVEDREPARAVVARAVGVAAVGSYDAGQGVRARGARCATGDPGLRRVGHVHDHQLAAADVRVLDVARARLVEVDPDKGEPPDAAVGELALTAVHRLVLELQ